MLHACFSHHLNRLVFLSKSVVEAGQAFCIVIINSAKHYLDYSSYLNPCLKEGLLTSNWRILLYFAYNFLTKRIETKASANLNAYSSVSEKLEKYKISGVVRVPRYKIIMGNIPKIKVHSDENKTFLMEKKNE